MLCAIAMAQSLPEPNSSFAHTNTLVDWPQFQFDPAHTGYNPYEVIIGPQNVNNLVLAWKYHPPNNSVGSSPSIANGVLYFGTDLGAYVYALDAETGAKLWSASTPYAFTGTPAIAYGNVYVDASRGDSGAIYAFDATTGASKWVGGGYAFGSSVTVDDGAVYDAVTWGEGENYQSDVYALDANTGMFLWQNEKRGGELGAYPPPAVANGVVYAGCPGTILNQLCAFDEGTGMVRWQYTTAGIIFSPAVSNGVVYIGVSLLIELQPYVVQNSVYALDAATGVLLWQSPLGVTAGGTINDPLTTPAVANGVVYIGEAEYTYPQQCSVSAINATTGAHLWRFMTGAPTSPPAVANGVVYFGTNDGNVYALDEGTGALLWRYSIGRTAHGGVWEVPFSSPAVVNGMLYIASETESTDSYMYAFHLPNQ